MNGFISLHRKFLNWGWYEDNNVKVLFLHLLLKASWDDKYWKGILIKRGQLICSLKTLSKETGLTNQNIRTCLSKLESTQEINKQTTSNHTLITICNYSTYQSSENETNKQLTNDQQMTNKRLTNDQQHLNKEIKKIKEKEKETNTKVLVKKSYNEKVESYFTSEDFEDFHKKLMFNYPETKLKAEYKKAYNWLIGNPKKQKRDFTRFITNWINNSGITKNNTNLNDWINKQ